MLRLLASPRWLGRMELGRAGQRLHLSDSSRPALSPVSSLVRRNYKLYASYPCGQQAPLHSLMAPADSDVSVCHQLGVFPMDTHKPRVASIFREGCFPEVSSFHQPSALSSGPGSGILPMFCAAQNPFSPSPVGYWLYLRSEKLKGTKDLSLLECPPTLAPPGHPLAVAVMCRKQGRRARKDVRQTL